ncbi:hypothetical protein [Aerococcus sp. UMB7834]|uniref:hypothetical protein n=1 Tax=Aerococcus sp. UMB7834 TaxID=3046342 RepID=UPI00254D538C|nr:hypothetical protein [Aerococcus sp. UMB7834]MDK6804521.1 hypothetical protein [Aerococcus sp. UMB7834]
MFKKKLSVITSILAISLPIFINVPVSVRAIEQNEQVGLQQESNQKYSISDHITNEDKKFMEKYSATYSQFELDSEGKLLLGLTDDQLINDYNFSNSEVEKIHEIINYQHTNVDNAKNMTSNGDTSIVTPYLHVSDWKVYFTYDDLVMYVSSAAQIGPQAIVAALAGLGSVVATPGVGTVIGTAIGLFSAGTIAYQVTQALANQQGWYIGVTWNGAFPNPDSGTW